MTADALRTDHSPRDARWSARHAERWGWASWESAHSLFNPESGETHLLGDLAVAALGELARGPATTAELSAALAKACDTADDDAWQRRVDSILTHLDAIELLDRNSL